MDYYNYKEFKTFIKNENENEDDFYNRVYEFKKKINYKYYGVTYSEDCIVIYYWS